MPGHAPWTDGRALVEWARRAERRGFSTLSVSDRLVWTTLEPLITLAAAAGATSRIRLLTSVLLAPLRTNHARPPPAGRRCCSAATPRPRSGASSPAAPAGSPATRRWWASRSSRPACGRRGRTRAGKGSRGWSPR
ncbi:LLM class flavin-dependent oxidoreductase [Nonomuraea sp. NPDC050404]|uniref:LLM class flavin-dependent oxidoreductase n=1 Tax=Nonomuraea sp. NPDC050404 TaxID=3155783 RepID=UPI0033FC1925